MKTLFAAVALMAFGQAALATEPATAPLVLNDMQMDQVTAGGPPRHWEIGQVTGFDGITTGATDTYQTNGYQRIQAGNEA
jgi:hypothetical protein